MSIAVPNILDIMIWGRFSRSGPEWTQRILDAFESVPELAPTHWGPDERARTRYNREDAIAYAASQQPQLRVPTFRRTARPTYLAYPGSTSSKALFGFALDFDAGLGEDDVRPIYQLAVALAHQMEPEFGFVHPAFLGDDCTAYADSGGHKFGDFAMSGPRAVLARTWLGPHVVGLLGPERVARLAAAGFDVEDVPSGGVRLDLASPPWEANCAALTRRQAQAMDVLRDSGVFGDYSGLLPKPGPRWVRPTPVPAGASADAAPPEQPSLLPVVQRLKQAVAARQQVDNADISGLDLKYIDLTDLNAPGLHANGTHLEGALLTGARLTDSFLADSHLDNANLAGANLTMATFEGASLRNASLERTTLAFAFCNKTDLTEADLTDANLEETGFADSRLDRAILRHVNAERTVFNRASLAGADLRQGQFLEAAFRHADLTGANLSEADFTEADFRGAKLEGVNWQGARLDRAQFDPTNSRL